MNQPYWNELPGAATDPADILHGDERVSEESDMLVNEPSGASPAVPPPPPVLDPEDFAAFFGLDTNPFADAINPEYFYRTVRHDETLISMKLAVRNNLSLGLVTGPSGSGKTLISQLVLNSMDPHQHEAVLILVSPGMSKTALMKDILAELNIPLPADHFASTQDLLKLLSDHVIEMHRQNRRLIILIDECHFLSSESLHMVRTLTNLEIPERKLITCLLFGESRFLKRLDHPAHASLRNRIYLRNELGPLTAEECAEYVRFRLLRAGCMNELFDEAAFTALHECSGGMCRNINKLATLALIRGFLQRKPTLDEETVRACADRM
jgi:general secretion pathway protein A